MDIYEVAFFCPLLCASLPFPTCGFPLHVATGSHEICISRPDFLESWIFICKVSRHLWACKSETTHFCPLSFHRTILLILWFLLLVLLSSQSPTHNQNSSVHSHPLLSFAMSILQFLISSYLVSLHLSTFCLFVYFFILECKFHKGRDFLPLLFSSLAARSVPDT